MRDQDILIEQSTKRCNYIKYSNRRLTGSSALKHKRSEIYTKTAKLQKICGPYKKDSMKKAVKSKVAAQKWL